MPTPTIPNGETQFFPIIYEGNGGGQRVGKFVNFSNNGTIANSLIFNRADNATMTRTPSSAGTRTKFTVSVWVKLSSNFGTRRFIFYGAASGNNFSGIEISSNNRFRMYASDGSGSIDLDLEATRTLEDTSKWYHLLAVFDSTQSTASDRAKMYIDGDQVTTFSTSTFNLVQDFEFQGTNNVLNVVGGWDSSLGGSPATYAFDGYMAEMNLVDGSALTPDTFGLTDTSTGRWIPKTLTGITYGTNGFRLQFASPSNLGDDTSGNTQDFGVNNIVAGDQTTDSPTQNHATFDPGRNGGDWTLSEGNLKIVGTPSTGAGRICLSGMNVPNSNKIYWEVEGDAMNDAPRYLGIFRDSVSLTAGASTEDMRYISIRAGGTHDGKVWDGTSTSSQLTTFSAGDIIQFARDGEKLWIGKNNTWLNSGNPSTGANPLLTNIDTNSNWKMGVYSVSTGSGGASHTFIANTGQRTFSYTPPTDFSAWQQDNLPETDKGIVGLTWIKDRDNAYSHGLRDSSRGRHKDIFSNLTQAEVTNTDGVQKFLKGGIQIEDLTGLNASGASIVAWNWVANGGTTATSNDGSLTSTVQVNQTAGFSIVQGKYFQGTLGHGLSQTPEWIIYKETSPNTNNWFVWHKNLTSTNYYLYLNSSQAQANYGSTLWAPTSTTFATNLSLGGDRDAIAYCWHEVDGFSKFGSYQGNGSTDGTFVYTGFKPAFLMIKSSSHAVSWYMFDNKRNPLNPAGKRLVADGTFVEDAGTTEAFDFLSNGFKLKNTSVGTNGSGYTYIYMAFAEHPFVGDGTNPTTAR
jgi:hypothetical protein